MRRGKSDSRFSAILAIAAKIIRLKKTSTKPSSWRRKPQVKLDIRP
jgi:hypothetical protein